MSVVSSLQGALVGIEVVMLQSRSPDSKEAAVHVCPVASISARRGHGYCEPSLWTGDMFGLAAQETSRTSDQSIAKLAWTYSLLARDLKFRCWFIFRRDFERASTGNLLPDPPIDVSPFWMYAAIGVRDDWGDSAPVCFHLQDSSMSRDHDLSYVTVKT